MEGTMERYWKWNNGKRRRLATSSCLVGVGLDYWIIIRKLGFMANSPLCYPVFLNGPRACYVVGNALLKSDSTLATIQSSIFRSLTMMWIFGD